MILYINACPRNESRTDKLAKVLLSNLGEYEEIKLDSLDLKPMDNIRLDYRTELIGKKEYGNEMFALARQFATADTIVIAAPFWDGSFPSILKVYIENIYVTGLVSAYGENGAPIGLCKADKMYYVTTAGGPYDSRFSYEYLRFLAVDMFGIKETELIHTEFMDIVGNNPDEILKKKIDEISANI